MVRMLTVSEDYRQLPGKGLVARNASDDHAHPVKSRVLDRGRKIKK